SRYQASDRVGRDERRRGSLPAPVLLVEMRWRGIIEKNVISTLTHRPRLPRPSRARPGCCAHNDAARFCPKFHFFWKRGLIQQQLGHANTARISDTHDPGLGGHVITV